MKVLLSLVITILLGLIISPSTFAIGSSRHLTTCTPHYRGWLKVKACNGTQVPLQVAEAHTPCLKPSYTLRGPDTRTPKKRYVRTVYVQKYQQPKQIHTMPAMHKTRYAAKTRTTSNTPNTLSNYIAQLRHTNPAMFIPKFSYPFKSSYAAKSSGTAKSSCAAKSSHSPRHPYGPRLAYNSNACPQNLCCRYEAVCQCTDEGWRYNCCISHCRYCMAFGNVGAR